MGFRHLQTMREGGASYLAGIRDILVDFSSGLPVLYSATGPGGGVSAFSLEGGRAEFLGERTLPQATGVPGLIQLAALPGSSGLRMALIGYAGQPIPSWDIGAEGALGGRGFLSAGSSSAAALTCFALVETSAGLFGYGGLRGQDRPSVFSLSDSGLHWQAGPAEGTAQGAGLSALVAAQAHGDNWIFTADNAQDVVRAHRVAADGSLMEVSRIGAGSGLGVNAPNALAVAHVAGETFLVVAAAGSSSLSVLTLEADGLLLSRDHLIDTQATRFGGVQQMEALTMGDRTYVAAAGGDGGLSLFLLLPDGRLLHLESLADSAATTLADVSALILLERNGQLEILVASESEAGISRILYDPGPQGHLLRGSARQDTITGSVAADVLYGADGADVLNGGGGGDILIDGAGADVLTGGAGADTFVFTFDGAEDRITDFNPAGDRLDLSAFPLLRSLAQITVTPTATGAVLTYGTERLVIETHDGQSLDRTLLAGIEILNAERFPVSAFRAGRLLEGTPSPDRLMGSDWDDIIHGLAAGDEIYGRAGTDEIDGGAGDDRIYGDRGRDRLSGADGHDRLYGGSSDDVLDGGAGQDRLYGNDGSDTLSGGSGNDRLDGGLGFDRLMGDEGADELLGLAADDVLVGGGGDDRLFGGDGSDQLDGGTGADRLDGGQGADTLYGGAGDDFLAGVTGADRLYGGAGNDEIRGNNDPDLLFGDAGHDVLSGGQGGDRLYGGEGNDVISGDDGPDALYGEAGNDTLNGNAAHDHLEGGDGMDLLRGGRGNDTLLGGDGADRLMGGEGNDVLHGGAGDDFLYGNAASDMLSGGAGNDWLAGGSGRDRFIYTGGQDVIVGFANNVDTLVLDPGLWGGASLTPEQALKQARVVNGSTRFDFGGGDVLELQGVSHIASLADDLEFL